MGNPGSLALLKSLNYQTFSEYIDESYDNEKNIENRLYKVYNSIEEYFNFNIPTFTINIADKNTQAVLFPKDDYSSSPNYLTQHSWGYYCTSNDYTLQVVNQMIKDFFIENDFTGAIPSKPHLTMQYSTNQNIILHSCPLNVAFSITCTMKLVDITSGNPSNWTLLN